MAKCVEELQVWQRAEELVRAVSAATDAPSFLRHERLAEQMNDAADSILSNIAEGFGQGTDRGFARYLGIARGSCNEVRSHLAVAEIRRCVLPEARTEMQRIAEEISRMLTGLEKYLRSCNRKERF